MAEIRGYLVFVEPISEDGQAGYAAVVSGLPGCMSYGETPEEAMEKVVAAIDLRLDTASSIPNSERALA